MSKKKFLLDTVFNIIGTAIPIIILQLYTLPKIGDKFGEEQYGIVITFISLFTVLSFPFGNVLNNIRLLLNRKYEENNYSGDFNILLLYSMGISAILVAFCTFFYEGNLLITSILLMILITSLNLTREYYVVSFRIVINYKKILINNIILAAGYVIGTILFQYTGAWQTIYILGFGCSLLYIIKNSTLWKEPFEKTILFKSTTYKSSVLLGSSLLSNVLSYADKLLLFPLLGPVSVSIYYTSTIVGKIISMIINPINGVILSYLSKMEKIQLKIFLSIILVTSFIGLIGYFFTVFISPFVLNFLYPSWAEESLKYIYITSATAIVELMISVINPFILKFNNINWQFVINGTNIIVYLVSTIVLYNFYGLAGFCMGILVSSTYQFILMISIFLYEHRRALNAHL